MRGHVVQAFIGMAVQGSVFTHQGFEKILKIAQHIGIGIFLND